MCWYCGEPIQEEEPIGRSFRCVQCGKDLRSCRNCRFYLSGARGDCVESQAEPPSDREIANFCGWFSLNPKFRQAGKGQDGLREKSAAAKTAFDNLFS
ncbi:MAG TPA: hypothetical protein DEQ14_10165 [Treponema sp.]|nr:hypothetical protein [Treponema sp.]